MAKRNKYGRYCSVHGCLNNSNNNPELAYFSLPSEPERRAQWLTLMGREDYLNKNMHRVLVCEAHINPFDINTTIGRKILKKTASPTLRLPAGRRVACGVQVEMSDEEDELDVPGAAARRALAAGREPGTSRAVAKRKIVITDPAFETKSAKERQKEVQNLQRYNFYDLCNQYLSKDLAQFVKTYNFLRLNNRDDRFSGAYTKFCWGLYFASRQTYQLFEKILGLPHINTLKKMWTPISTQMSDDFLVVLKAKVDNMTQKEKNCSLIISVTDVKPNLCYLTQRDTIVGLQEVDGVQSPSPAKCALVVLLRGLLVEWTQPVVYVFLAECKSYHNISIWIQKVVLKLLETGLKVRAIVSSLGSDLTKSTKNEHVTVNEPFFFVKEHKIYQIVDTSYLIKQVCSCFKMFDFHFEDERVAKFEHVRKFYELDKSRSVRLACDLTDDHMEAMAADEIDVEHAEQLMSSAVARGVSVFADFNVIEPSAKDTVLFLLLMNELIDCLKKFRGEDSQLELLHKVQRTFCSLKVVDPHNDTDVTKIIDFLEGLHITVKSITLLHDDLKTEGYNNAMFTRHLNQDIVEAFFKKIRARSSAASDPTCRRLAAMLRSFYTTSILKPIKGHNSSIEMVQFIEEIYEISLRSGIGAIRSIFTIPSKTNEFFEIACSDYNRFGLPDNNSLLYMCGCLLNKCHDRHQGCDMMENYMKVSDVRSRYTKYMEFAKKKGSEPPAIPPDEFVEHVVKLERVFGEEFGSTHLAGSFGVSIYDKIRHIQFSAAPCPCFPVTYLHKLFVRMRLYSTIRFNNNTLRAQENIKQEC